MPRRRRKTYFDESLFGNMAMYYHYRDSLTELALSMFDWQNLPDSVDPRFLELTLFKNGSAVFFRDDVIGFLALPVAMNGPFNVYQVPTRRHAYAANGFSADLGQDDSVLIYNNMLRKNSLMLVETYARRLWDIDRSIDVNARAQKTPVILQCDESRRLTVSNLFKEVDGNAPVIYADSNLDIKDVLKAVNIGAPYVADKLYQLKTEIWNEALTKLGIPNISYQKKERMITDEVQRLQGGTIASRYSRLEMRQRACEQINDMFNLDIWVEYKDIPGDGSEDVQDPEDGEQDTENG